MVEFNKKFSTKHTIFMIAYATAPIVFLFLFFWNGYEFETLNNFWKGAIFFGVFLYILAGYVLDDKLRERPPIQYAFKDRLLGVILASPPLLFYIWLRQSGHAFTWKLQLLFLMFLGLMFVLYKKYLKNKERR